MKILGAFCRIEAIGFWQGEIYYLFFLCAASPPRWVSVVRFAFAIRPRLSVHFSLPAAHQALTEQPAALGGARQCSMLSACSASALICRGRSDLPSGSP